MRGVAGRVAGHCGLQHRNGFLRVQGTHQRITHGGQHVVGQGVAFGLQRPCFLAHLRMSAQAVEQDQPVHADAQRRLRRQRAFAPQIALHAGQG
ncbi:hypothetical protein G6F57_022308 [Rhizopus arrhizus]|nr:hypothetical protein G6F57_022308 [Rhizopus arrhizus]